MGETTERVLRLLGLLQQRPVWTGPELAERLGVTTRSIRRDVERLRALGYDDRQIFAITLFIALRLAFSTVNDALGVRPDAQLRDSAPAAVLDAVTFGRPIAEA